MVFVCIKILFSEMDAAATVIADRTSCFEEKEGLPVEAFAKVQEIFNHVDWLNPKADVALDVLQNMSDSASAQHVDTGSLLHEKNPKIPLGKKNEEKRLDSSNLEIKFMSATKQSVDNDSKKGDEPVKIGATPQLPGCQKVPIASISTSESSKYEKTSAKLDLKPQVDGLSLTGSMDTSSVPLSPRTPPLQPSLISNSKRAHDTPLLMQPPPHNLSPLEPGYPVTGENEDPSEDRSQSSIFSSTSGTPLSSTFPNKLPSDGASHPSALPITSTQSPATPTTPLKEILHVKTRPASSTSQLTMPPTPPTPAPPAPLSPPTPPQKENKMVRATPLPPPPPQKEQSLVRVVPPPPPPPPPKEESHGQFGPPSSPTLPLKEEPHVRPGSPPCPPPPLKEELPVRARPPLPPPLPCPSGKAVDPTIAQAPPPPPPPPAATLSSKHPNTSLQNSSPVPVAPNAPPPPVPFGKGDLKSGNDVPGSLSGGGDGNSMSSSMGSQRSLSRTLNFKNQNKKLKPLHWLKISRAVQGSLWAEAQKSGEASKYVCLAMIIHFLWLMVIVLFSCFTRPLLLLS